jgi:hypothetical protein
VLRSAAPEASSQTVEDALIKSVPSNNAKSAFVSPQLPLALAQLTGKAVANGGGKLTKLRWQPVLTDDAPLQLNAKTLARVLPWEERITSLTGEGVQGKSAGEWELKPAAGKSSLLSAKSASGREYAIELLPRVELAAASSMARHAPVSTMMNAPVMIPLLATGAALPKQGLRLSSPTRGGKVKLHDNGQVEYTPPHNFIGSDQFTYSMPQPDGKPGATTLVTVLVRRS